jgi:Matrixin
MGAYVIRLFIPLSLILTFVLATAVPVQAQTPITSEVRAEPVRDKPIGGGKKLTVFVDYTKKAKGGKPSTSTCATDADQSQAVPQFANAASGLNFRINRSTFPSAILASADGGVRAGFRAWDDKVAGTYFGLTTTPAAPTRPAPDGTNTVGWARISGTALAAAWVYEDANGQVQQADIFFNTRYPWGVFDRCPGSGTYEVGNVASHEAGHVLGLDHLSDSGRKATMYPSAPRNEVLKRTLTTGDVRGFNEALGQ